MDSAIGVILKELEDRGELENTIIVYSADHGDYAGEHGLYEKKGGISYRAVTRVPMLMRLPGGEYEGSVRDELMETVDVFPTMCDLAGMDIPATVQGSSFLNLIRGKSAAVRDSALTENPYRKALAVKEWRFVANLGGEQEDELYNIGEDPMSFATVFTILNAPELPPG